MSKKELKSALSNVLDHMIDLANKEREKDPTYQKLFRESISGDSLLRKADHEMTKIALDTDKILKEKFGIKADFKLLLGLPLICDILEERIKKEEGITCCVDKVFYLLAKVLTMKDKESK